MLLGLHCRLKQVLLRLVDAFLLQISLTQPLVLEELFFGLALLVHGVVQSLLLFDDGFVVQLHGLVHLELELSSPLRNRVCLDFLSLARVTKLLYKFRLEPVAVLLLFVFFTIDRRLLDNLSEFLLLFLFQLDLSPSLILYEGVVGLCFVL